MPFAAVELTQLCYLGSVTPGEVKHATRNKIVISATSASDTCMFWTAVFECFADFLEMSKYVVETLPVSKVWLGDAPHWDAKTGKLYYVDVPKKTIYSFDPGTSKVAKISIGMLVYCSNN